MPTSPLKRPSGGGGRLRRLLASLRPPARVGPLPVQTGFPTSLADIVVKNHGRFRTPRRRQHTNVAAVPQPTTAAEPQQRRDLSAAHDASAAQVPALIPARPAKRASFSIRPGLLVVGGAVAFALLVIWSKQLVAAATLASVALSWIESARTVRALRPETEEVVDVRRGRGRVSPIGEAALSPRRSCGESESYHGSSDAASLWSADDTSDLVRDGSSSVNNNPKQKQSRRSLRKLLANKLRSGNTPRGRDSRHAGDAGEHEHEPPETPRRLNAEPAAAATAAPAEATPAPPQEAITVNDDEDRCHRRRGGALPLPALVPIILAGLVAGKLLALALAVLCAAFSSSVGRVPAEQATMQQRVLRIGGA